MLSDPGGSSGQLQNGGTSGFCVGECKTTRGRSCREDGYARAKGSTDCSGFEGGQAPTLRSWTVALPLLESPKASEDTGTMLKGRDEAQLRIRQGLVSNKARTMGCKAQDEEAAGRSADFFKISWGLSSFCLFACFVLFV